VIYVAFTFWLFLILLAGLGIYRLLGMFVRARWVDWALLPGTVISEMAYIFGCLITGAEIRRAKLINSASGPGGKNTPGTEVATEHKTIGPIIAAIVAIMGCMGAIVAVHALLGDSVIRRFITSGGSLPNALPKALPLSWEGFWAGLAGQVGMMQRMAETWIQADWLDWHVLLYVYLTLCLAIRLAPVSRPVRPTLAAAVAISAVIALAALVTNNFQDLMEDIWPLMTYLWASLLLVLMLTLGGHGIVRLVLVLMGRKSR